MKVTVEVMYSEPHFNATAYCNVPGAYRFEVADAAEVMGERETESSHFYLYADGFTFREGYDYIVSELQKLGHGTMRLVGDVPPRSEWDADVRDGLAA